MALMAKRSLFAVLSRSPWWLSVLLAAAVFMLVRQFMPDYAAAASTLPFLGIAGYAGWRQSRVPNPERVVEVLATLRAMSWQEFASIMEAGFCSEGYAVAVLTRGAADFELRKGGRVALAACKRWKVAQTGILAKQGRTRRESSDPCLRFCFGSGCLVTGSASHNVWQVPRSC